MQRTGEKFPHLRLTVCQISKVKAKSSTVLKDFPLHPRLVRMPGCLVRLDVALSVKVDSSPSSIKIIKIVAKFEGTLAAKGANIVCVGETQAQWLFIH